MNPQLIARMTGSTEKPTMNRRPNPQKEVDAWNARVQVGQMVQYAEVNGLTEPKTFKTRTPAELLSGHTAVVWLEGKSDCVCVSHCKPIIHEIHAVDG